MAATNLFQRIQQPYHSLMYGQQQNNMNVQWGQMLIQNLQDFPDDILGWICTFLGLVDITFLGMTTTRLRQISAQCSLSVYHTDLLEMSQRRLWNPSTKIKIFDFRPREDPPHSIRYILRYLHLVFQSSMLEELAVTWPASNEDARGNPLIRLSQFSTRYPKLKKISFMDTANLLDFWASNDELKSLFKRAPNLQYLAINELKGQNWMRYLPKLESLTVAYLEANVPSVQQAHILDMRGRSYPNIQKLKCLPNIRRLQSDIKIWDRQYVEYLSRIRTLETIEMECDSIGFPWLQSSEILKGYNLEEYQSVFDKIRCFKFTGCEYNTPGSIWRFIKGILCKDSFFGGNVNVILLNVHILTRERYRQNINKIMEKDVRRLVQNLHSLCCQVTLKVVIDYRHANYQVDYPKPTIDDMDRRQNIRTLTYL